jgi:hypothetical protein
MVQNLPTQLNITPSFFFPEGSNHHLKHKELRSDLPHIHRENLGTAG